MEIPDQQPWASMWTASEAISRVLSKGIIDASCSDLRNPMICLVRIYNYIGVLGFK
jgi:hypothetical protein